MFNEPDFIIALVELKLLSFLNVAAFQTKSLKITFSNLH